MKNKCCEEATNIIRKAIERLGHPLGAQHRERAAMATIMDTANILQEGISERAKG